MKMTQPQKWLLFFASLMGFISIAAGAFGSHALKLILTPEMLSAFEIGASYQMYHALAIFLCVWLSTLLASPLAPLAGWLFLIGSLIFSGGLYLMALTGIRSIGVLTTLGGLFLLLGWFSLALSFFTEGRERTR